VSRYPIGYAMFMHGALFAIGPSREIVIAGRLDDSKTTEMLEMIRSHFLPQTVVSVHEPGEAGARARAIMPVLAGKDRVDGQATVYVCENFACHAPVTTTEALQEQLAIGADSRER